MSGPDTPTTRQRPWGRERQTPPPAIHTEPTGASDQPGEPGRGLASYGPEILVVVLIGALALRTWIVAFDDPTLQTWATIFVSITIQATPFLVLGVTVSGAIAAFVSPAMITRLLPQKSAFAVPSAGLAGAVLPGCECGSVPIAGRLTAQGAAPAAAFAFMLAAPAINPVVMVATAVAFPGRPDMVIGRFVASFATAVLVGYLWARFGRTTWLRPVRRHSPPGATRWEVFVGTARHDFLHAGGWLVVGAMAAGALQVLVPRSIITTVASNEWLAVLVLAGLAVVLAICSEADAFVAASLTQFSMTSRLVFLVVGPVVDIKLIAMQAGVFGRGFAIRFAPLAFVVAVGCALLVGWWLL